MQPIVPQQQEQFHAAQSHAHSDQQHPTLESHSPHSVHNHLLHQHRQTYDPQQTLVNSHITATAHTQFPTAVGAAAETTIGKHRSSTHYGQRYNPMFATTTAAAAGGAPSTSTASSSVGVATSATSAAASIPQISLDQSAAVNHAMTYANAHHHHHHHHSQQQQQQQQHPHHQHQLFPQSLGTTSGLLAGAAAAVGTRTGTTMNLSMMGGAGARQSLVHQSSPPIRSHDLLTLPWSSTYVQGYENNAATTATTATAHHPGLLASNFYARSLHTPFYPIGLPLTDEAQFDYGPHQGASALALLGASSPLDSFESGSGSGSSRLPGFDVKAYTFRKKSRHYVAVKHRNALRIEPIIYLKTSILDNHRDLVRHWDYLRFSIHRFRENALPKKKLSAEELRTARILDVNISLVSPNNKNRQIEDSCPACVMRMDGERKIMQVLAKNFKLTPLGEPVIDIRKGHAIICIKLNCYCDHHNEQEGFVVRMQTEPELVRVGGSVKLRICCEARSKLGPTEPEVEEEDGLTDIDAPVSTGSRSPSGLNDRSVQSPSLSYGSESPDLSRTRQRHQRQVSSTNSISSTASPRSLNDRVVSALAVESSPALSGNGSTLSGRTAAVLAPPAFRQIYPLTPSEGTCLGGTRVTIHGSNFDLMQNPVVYFGKIPAELVTISHHDVMECTTPPAEGLKPGIVAVRIASLAFPLGVENDSVDFMYMAPPDYDFYNLAATSLSYAMANEYPHDDSLSYILNAHSSSVGAALGLGQGAEMQSGNTISLGLVCAAKEDVALDFLRVIQTLAPGRILPAFQGGTGQTLLHLAAQSGMLRLSRELLAMGIDHTALDRNRKTALHYAEIASHTEIARAIAEARAPPRPMVPRLDANKGNSTGTGPSTMIETVATLIQKHEGTLYKVLAQERDRKTKDLAQLRDRSLKVMELRDKTPVLPSRFHVTIAAATGSDVDVDGDEIMDFSEQSSPSTRSFDEEEQDQLLSPREDMERSRKVTDEEPALATTSGTLNGLLTEIKGDFEMTDAKDIDAAQLAYIHNGIEHWEGSRGVHLFGDSSELSIMATDIQVWFCESARVASLKESQDGDTHSPRLFSSAESVSVALAVSGRGLHLYMERCQQQGSTRDLTTKRMEHWSLAEIEALDDLQDVLSVEMCGLVPRGGRDLSSERILVKPSATNSVSEIVQAIDRARVQLDGYQNQAMNGSWIEARLKMWSRLFNVGEREFKFVTTDHLQLQGDALVMKTGSDNDLRGHSLAMMGAVIRTARDLETCAMVQFDGVTVVEDGWSRPELIKELEKTVRAMKPVTRWGFSRCGWSIKTVQGFLTGLKENGSQCREISLAGNRFRGADEVGHWLTESIYGLNDFDRLDLMNCEIGLAGMEDLVHHLSGLVEIRLQGNWADDRWWQWMDTVLERNPLVQRCSLGAPIALQGPQKSLVSLERLKALEDLIEIDLSESPITPHTLEVLEARVRHDPEHLRTLALSHCNLSWSSLENLFSAVCKMNRSAKFTLDIGRNPLFDSEESVQRWERAIEAAQAQVPFGIQMTDLLISDSTLQRVLAPLEHAGCFNELNFKGLYVKRARQAEELDSLCYDDARAKAIPEGASAETCLALGRILTFNSTLVMLDVSGRLVDKTGTDPYNAAASTVASSARGAERRSRSTGGFGRQVALAFPALAKNSTLRILAMDHNRFGEESIINLSESLRVNESIGVLSCDGNDAFTAKGLQAIEGIFSAPQPLTDATTILFTASSDTAASGNQKEPSSLVPSSQGYNTTLSVWRLGGDEILMHVQLLTREVQRLSAEYNRIEKMQASSMHGEDIKFLGSTPLPDVKRRYENAEKNLIEYSETHARIVKAIEDNNRRSKEAHDLQMQMQQQLEV